MKIHHDPSQRWPCEALSSWETFTGLSCIFRVLTDQITKTPNSNDRHQLLGMYPTLQKKWILRQVRVICFIKWWFKLQHFATLQTLPFNLRWFINCGVFHPHKCVFSQLEPAMVFFIPFDRAAGSFSSNSTNGEGDSGRTSGKWIGFPSLSFFSRQNRSELVVHMDSLCSFNCFLCGIPHFGQTHSYLLNQHLHVKEGGAHNDEPISARYKVPNRELTTFGCQHMPTVKMV